MRVKRVIGDQNNVSCKMDTQATSKAQGKMYIPVHSSVFNHKPDFTRTNELHENKKTEKKQERK